ncbi:NADP-dependent malic enzyme [Drosophila mojavensis]|uniref:Uncharacterized protein n=1 Tax=Drosophila mojavensis TaxID=7230 RepID=B4KSH3_DROMO|nr:NADP-dependent malic enzyme [Drosophila mojavensis]EDW09478.1 uncharacterized protein Dmoj_GI19011 [Drosophila mojavensis]
MSAKKLEQVYKCVDAKAQLAVYDAVPVDRDTFWRWNEEASRNTTSGHEIMRISWLNKTMAFTHREQQLLSIHGLFPYAIYSLEQQVKVCQQGFARFTTPFQKYLFLSDMEARNRRLFYNVLISDPDTYMSIYKANECPNMIKNFGMLYTNNRGMYVTIKDRGHIYNVLRNWPLRHCVRYLMVTNGHCVMNMGDFGSSGAPVVFYKLYENVVYGGMNPDCCLPIMMDVGTDNDCLVKDPLYLGVRQPRTTGAAFDDFFEEFTVAVLRVFGPRAVIQTKDFSPKETLSMLEKYQRRRCYMDISLQLFGTCGLAGLLAALTITEIKLRANQFLFYGMEKFNIGLARMCVAYLKRQGLDDAAAKQCIWFCDSHGLIVKQRGEPKVPDELLEFAHDFEAIGTLLEAIEKLKPTVLVGCSAEPQVFTKEVLRAMEQSCQMPIIFAMSRPLPLAECSADDAFVYTKGRCIFISGCDLPPLKYANKWYQPGYCTDIYIHTGLTLGIMLTGMTTVPEEIFLIVAERLSNLVWPTDLAKRNVYPPQSKFKCVNLQIAEAVFSYAYRHSLATLWPEPSDPMAYIKSKLFNPQYSPSIPELYCTGDQHVGTTESKQYYQERI